MKLKKLILIIFTLIFVSACNNKQPENLIKVGTIAGPETELMEIAKTVLKDKYDLDMKIIEFSDYSIPNAALADGSIDINMFQHLPYLEAFNKAHGYDLVSIAKTFVYPMGIYSKKLSKLRDLPHLAIVAIPNDPSNEARALLLLQKAGFITLIKNAQMTATPVDIIRNPKQLQFKEIDAAQLPRVLDDVDIAIINTNFAIPAGLMPSKDALFKEGADSPYANIFVVRSADKDNAQLLLLIKAFQSDAVLEAAKKTFKGEAIPAWKK